LLADAGRALRPAGILAQWGARNFGMTPHDAAFEAGHYVPSSLCPMASGVSGRRDRAWLMWCVRV